MARQDIPRDSRASGEGGDPDPVRQVVEEHRRRLQSRREGQQGESFGCAEHW